MWFDVSFTFEVLLHEYWSVGLLFAGIVFVGSAIFERFWSRPNAV
jgi:hypothetical protein